MSSNTFIITTQGLQKVSREVINKRNFVSSKITKVGNTSVTDKGIASGFAALVTGQTVPSYFMQDLLSFSDSDTIKIVLEGKFISKKDDNPCCMWSLIGTDVSSLDLAVTSSKVQLRSDNVTIASITDLEIADNDNVRVEVICTTTGCTINATVAGEYVYTNTTTFSSSITFEAYDTLLVGVLNTIGTDYWQGDIDLAELSVYKNDELYYSPSIDNIFKFTKLLVCDSSITLTDSSKEVVNHCYEIPIEELKRSFNNILISAQIPSNYYLNINQIGLYSTGNDGTQLFALLDNLAIKKSKGLGYNLLFNVSIDLSVVNTLVMPNFILSTPVSTKYVDFDNVRKKFALAETDLERMIEVNAREVGYKRPQQYYRLQDDIELIEDNYMAVRNFLRTADDFQELSEKVFDYSKAVVYEPLTIEDSIASGFTTSNFVMPEYMAIGGNNIWEFVVPFKTSSNISATQGIVSAYSCNYNTPFSIYISSGSCRVKISKPETISFTFNLDSTAVTYTRNSQGTSVGSTNYYFWTTDTNVPAYGMVLKDTTNSYTYNKESGTTTISGGTYYTWSASESSYTIQELYTSESNPTSSSTIYKLVSGSLVAVTELTFNTLNTISTVYTTAKNPTSASNFYYMSGSTILPITQLTFTGYNRGVLIDKSIFTVEPFTKYYFKVNYDETAYKFYTSSNGEDYTIVDTESIATEMATSNNICIGVSYSDNNFTPSYSDPFLGGIDLSGLYLSKQGFETTGMILTDSSLDEYTYNKSIIYYGWTYNDGTTDHTIYTKEQTITASTKMYTIDGTEYTGSDFTIVQPTGQEGYVIQYQGYTTSASIPYYTWSASESSYSIQTIYSQDPDPIASSRLYKLSGGSLVALTELTFKELITIPAAIITDLAKTVITNDSILKDYFHIPTYNYSSYKVINLCDSTSKIEVLDCSLTGNKVDNIDFSGTKGFTLLTKVYLKELYDDLEGGTGAASETILAKTSLGSTQYLNISLSCNSDKSIYTITASLANGNFIVSKDIDYTEIASYTDYPILLTITYDADSSGRLLKLYKNNTLINSLLIPIGTTISAPTSTDKITNYLTTAEMANAYSCISDIIFIDGPVNESQLYYVTNLLDCNF